MGSYSTHEVKRKRISS